MLDEELLAAWLRLTTVIDNQRLAVSCAADQPRLPFNEAMVCGLLYAAQASGESLTASGLCRRTRILKSQMNAILRSLERKGALSRRRSDGDRRQIELRLELTDNRRISFSLVNACPRPVRFSADGLPAAPAKEGHGLGLQSVRSVADRYGGLLQCRWEEGRFYTQMVLFPPSP